MRTVPSSEHVTNFVSTGQKLQNEQNNKLKTCKKIVIIKLHEVIKTFLIIKCHKALRKKLKGVKQKQQNNILYKHCLEIKFLFENLLKFTIIYSI